MRADLYEHGFRYAFALTHDRRDAEDVLHEAWLSARRRWRRPNKAYLFAAIRHRWVDRLRKGRRDPPLEDLTTEVSAPEADLDSVPDRLDLKAALQRLTSREREVLYLMTVEGWTAQEISKLMGAPRGTVLSLSHRAKGKMLAFLEPEGGHHGDTRAR
ncbi:MAG: RNA polymerase sigma factor [Myxococcota bacterium]